MLRMDRLETMLETVVAAAASAPDSELEAALGPKLGPIVRMLRRAPRPFRVDVLSLMRATLLDSLTRLGDTARADPVRADELLQRSIHVVAWLDGQTDEAPQLPQL